MKYYHCPNCGVSIPDKGDKILKHKTFCKSSYDNFAPRSIFAESTIENLSDLVAVNMNRIPQGITIKKDPEGETKITYKQSAVRSWLFLFVFLLPAAYFFLPETHKIPVEYMTLIFISYGIVLLLFLLGLISAKLGKWELTLKNGKGTFFCGMGKFGQRQKFEYNTESSVSICMLNETNMPASGLFLANAVTLLGNSPLALLAIPWLIAKTGIVVTTNGKQFTFGGTLSQSNVMKYMAAYILREISK